MSNEIIEGEFSEAQSMSMVQQLVKAEIDIQVSTAHQYPRSITKVNKNITSLATMSQAAAEECNYALPRGGKPITGPSIRLAEIVSSQWGNCRVGARVVHVDRKEMYVEAEGIFHDLESNTATTARIRRRISGRNGKIFNDDMILVTGNAACSIAKRNAILSGVPKAVWLEAYEAALRTIKGDQKTLVERREGLMKAMAAFGLTPDDICALLGVEGHDDITLEHLPVAVGMHSSLKSGETTVEELMATIKTDEPRHKTGGITGSTKAKTAAKPKAATRPKPEPQSNPAADRALEDEAKRVAQKRAEEQHSADEASKGTKTPIDHAELAHDAETGEVYETVTPDLEQFQALYNTIVNDLMDASDPNDVVDMYSAQIEQMKASAPQLHQQLMAEVEAAAE